MKQILWILSFGLLLSAYATTEKYEANLQTWIGAPELEVVRSWGPLDSFYESGEIRYLTYHWSSSGVIPGTSLSHTSTKPAIRCKPIQLVGLLQLPKKIIVQLRLKYVQKKSLVGVGKGTIVSLSDVG